MKPLIRILHLEDDTNDAELVQARLADAGLFCRITLARTREEYENALDKGGMDIILADYRLPMYDGLSAMRLANELAPDLPFIFVSGTMGEEAAIGALTKGATDYVLKHDLSRLSPAVQRALEEARNRRERKQAQEKLEEERSLLRCLIDSASDLIFIKDRDSIYRACNKASEAFIGMPESEQIGKTDYDFFDREKAEEIRKADKQVIDEGKSLRIEDWVTCPDGRRLLMDTIKTPYYDPEGNPLGLVGIGRDATERELLAKERLAHLRFFESMDRINRVIQGAKDLEQMIGDVLEIVLSIFDSDRAYLMYPCDPDASEWSVPMERCKPGVSGAFAQGVKLPVDSVEAENIRILLNADGPVKSGPGSPYTIPENIAERFSIKSFLSLALRPKVGKPWRFGLHQCAYTRDWAPGDVALFQGIGRRLTDGLTSMLISRELQESEQRYRSLVENLPDFIARFDTELRHLYVNPAVSRAFDVPPDFFVGKKLSELPEAGPPGQVEFLENKLKEAVDTGNVIRLETEWSTQGRGRCFEIIHVPEKDEKGTVVSVFGITRDITDRKMAERNLRTLLENIPVCITRFDENCRIVYMNRAVEKYVGDPVQKIVGRRLSETGRPGSNTINKKLENMIRQVFTDGIANRGEANWNTVDGIRVFDFLHVPEMNEEGNVSSVLGISSDITDRKKAEDALFLKNRVNEILLTFPGKEMYWQILQVALELTESPYGYFGYLDEEGALVVPTLTGEIWEACQVPGKSFVFPLENWGDSIWGSVIRGKKSIYSNAPFTVPEGHISITRAIGIPIIYQREVIGHFLVANRETDYNDRDRELLEGIADLISPILYSRLQTEREEKLRERSEAETRHLKNHLANIIDSMPSMLVGIDKNEIITQWNRHVEMTTGIPAEQAVGKPVKQMFPDLSSHIEAMVGEIKQHRTAVMEKLPVEKKEERRLYDLMLYPLLTNGTEGAVLRIEDVTEQARIQNLMVQTEKMMSLGGLAAGMAHEINNPLGIITQAAQNLERRIFSNLKANLETAGETGVNFEGVKAYFEKRQIPEFIESIRVASKRASRIIENILKFSRGADSAMHPASLVSVIDQALDLAAGDYDLKKKYDFKSIEILRDFEPDLPAIPMVSVEMEQVLLNLLKNGAQAVSDNPSDRKPSIILRLRREERYVLIEVADNGHGMDEATRLRVFEPFFTTKEPGIGTGLGLSVAYMIVTQNHKGLMEVESTPGSGSCFKIRIPVKKIGGGV